MQPEEYRKMAEVEDVMWYYRALHRRMGHWLERLLPSGPARVLDAGCGTGGLIKSLQRRNPGWRIVGMDYSPQACELATKRTGTGTVCGSVTALPFGDGAFDGIVSTDVLSQIDDGLTAMREFSRCVRPGGVVLINVAALQWLWSYHDVAVSSKHRYSRRELVGLFHSVGLEVDFSSYANLLPLPLIVLQRKLIRPRVESDVRLYPPVVEAILSGMSQIEFAWMRAGIPSPIGSSVFVVGRRPISA